MKPVSPLPDTLEEALAAWDAVYRAGECPLLKHKPLGDRVAALYKQRREQEDR